MKREKMNGKAVSYGPYAGRYEPLTAPNGPDRRAADPVVARSRTTDGSGVAP